MPITRSRKAQLMRLMKNQKSQNLKCTMRTRKVGRRKKMTRKKRMTKMTTKVIWDPCYPWRVLDAVRLYYRSTITYGLYLVYAYHAR
nr:hypothetical protein Iba_chr05aCG6390 [Ipomoea batatas]GMC93776.1 hypothetical protein Iba_chr05bCG5620 [Ipomoea batatas]GMC97629.1 hypothetical protein Iba_chr05dCG8850 [Ipomoea batatas]